MCDYARVINFVLFADDDDDYYYLYEVLHRDFDSGGTLSGTLLALIDPTWETGGEKPVLDRQR